MREWFWVILPLAIIVGFLAFPDQLGVVADWTASLTQWVTASLH